MEYAKREKIKAEAHSVIRSNVSLEEKFEAAENLFMAYYFRSLEAFPKKKRELHPNYAIYVSMLLYAKEHLMNTTFSGIPEAEKLYKALVKEYGVRPGIESGRSYYKI